MRKFNRTMILVCALAVMLGTIALANTNMTNSKNAAVPCDAAGQIVGDVQGTLAQMNENIVATEAINKAPDAINNTDYNTTNTNIAKNGMPANIVNVTTTNLVSTAPPNNLVKWKPSYANYGMNNNIDVGWRCGNNRLSAKRITTNDANLNIATSSGAFS